MHASGMNTDWMASRLKELGKTQAEIATAFNITLPRASEFMNGRRRLDALELPKLARVLEMPPIAVLKRLMNGDDVAVPDEGAEMLPVQPDIPPPYTGDLSAGLVDVAGIEFASIGVYDARFSAGPGSIVEPGQQPEGYRLFEAQWLRAITSAAPDRLAVVRVDGDSMRETLDDGDFVLIDRSETRISRQGIYALRVGESCWVKRLSVSLKDRIVKVISDNPRYPEDQLQEDDLELLGRVLMIVARKV